MTTHKEVSYPYLRCAAASFIANYIAGILHPFDVIKTRFQSHDGKAHTQNVVPRYDGIINAFSTIHREEGLPGLFRGFHMSLLSQAVASAFFFWMYELQKEKHIENGWSMMNSVTLASLQAGVAVTVCTQPFWVVKTRMLLNTETGLSEWANFRSKSHEIFAQHGPSGFMRGLSINLVLAAVGISQMYIYEGSKILYDYLSIPQTPYSERNFLCGGVSKVVSGLLMYPFTTIRTRIQQNQFVGLSHTIKYQGIFDIVSKTWMEEGTRGFYKGLIPNIMKGIPQRGIYFYFYELLKQWMGVGSQ